MIRRIMIALFLLLIGGGTPATQAQNPANVFLHTVDESLFPDLSFTFRVVDDANQVVPNITADSLTLYEDGQEIEDWQVTTSEQGPAQVVFVVDLGEYAYERGFSAASVRQVLSQFVSGGYFRDDTDHVAVLTCTAEGAVVLLPPTQSQSEFLNAVNSQSFNETSGNTVGLGCVREAVEETLANLVEPGFGNTAVIYLSPLVHATQTAGIAREAEAATVAAIARQNRVAVYGFHSFTRSGSEQEAPPFQALAEGTGGEYLLLSSEGNTADLNRIYSNIQAQGTLYHASYRSQIAASGQHTIALVPIGTTDSQAPAFSRQTFTLTLDEAVVQITAPSNNTSIERDVTQTSSGTSLEPDSVTITAEIVSWPYSLESADIQSVELLVEGRPTLPLPNPGLGPYEFELDISTIEDGTERLVIQVQVTDKSNIAAASDSIQLNITADSFIPTQTPLPTHTPAPTTVPLVGAGDICAADPNSPECQQARLPLYLLAALGVALLIAIAMMFRYSAQVKEAVKHPSEAIRKIGAEVRKTILGGRGGRGKKVIAQFEVLQARKDLVGNTVKIYTHTTTLGRNPKLCDIQLYDEDESSSVSGQHCTIQYDRGTFFIIDNNSANGTEVDGQAIGPDIPVELKDGAEVILGDVFRRGAKLKFIIVQPETPPIADRTMLEDDLQLPATKPADDNKTMLDKDGEESPETFYDMPRPDFSKKRKESDKDWLNDLE